MSEITKEEFIKIYDKKFIPILSKLEQERISTLKKRNQTLTILIPSLVICVLFLIYLFFSSFKTISLDIIVLLAGITFFIIITVNSTFTNKIKCKIKKTIIPKILAIYGNLYISGNKEIITLREMQITGLFPSATRKTTDDVIIGIDKGCNFVISESLLQHTEGSGKSSHTVTDFHGLVVKIQMKKKVSGKIAVGRKGCVALNNGFDHVELESVDFMKDKDVVSTDQIEARYLLTTAFMERLEKLYKNFSNERSIAALKTNTIARYPSRGLVSVSVFNGYLYLFIPSYENFFEIDIDKPLLNPDNYYKIYCELESILSVIDYLNLTSNTGL